MVSYAAGQALRSMAGRLCTDHQNGSETGRAKQSRSADLSEIHRGALRAVSGFQGLIAELIYGVEESGSGLLGSAYQAGRHTMHSDS